MNTKNIILIIVIVVSIVAVIGLGAWYYMQNSPDSSFSLGDLFGKSADTENTYITLELTTQQIVGLIGELQGIKLDKGILLREDFNSLESFEVPIQAQPRGVSNPFVQTF
tara:strand:- start:2074 stop:2403 length:330 start_codon:yes stop_codon:yes gene_type:complete